MYVYTGCHCCLSHALFLIPIIRFSITPPLLHRNGSSSKDQNCRSAWCLPFVCQQKSLLCVPTYMRKNNQQMSNIYGSNYVCLLKITEGLRALSLSKRSLDLVLCACTKSPLYPCTKRIKRQPFVCFATISHKTLSSQVIQLCSPQTKSLKWFVIGNEENCECS